MKNELLSVEKILNSAKAHMNEIAEMYAPEHICPDCLHHQTPLAYENASDIHCIKRVESVTDDAIELMTFLVHGLYEGLEKHDEEMWVETELLDYFEDRYFKYAATPDNCDICRHESHCGHTWYNEECPVEKE